MKDLKGQLTPEEMAEVEKLANRIWSSGECRAPSLCLNPDNPDHVSLTVEREDARMDPFTHYAREWAKRGESVRIRLFTSPAYGAVEFGEMEFVGFVDVKIKA